MANQFKASKNVKASVVKIALLRDLLELKAEFAAFERFDLGGNDPALLKLIAEQIVVYENAQEGKYSLFEMATRVGIDPAVAQKQIMEYLVRIFGNADFALEYYAKAFSKEVGVVQLSGGSWIVEGKSVEECNKFSFKQTDSSQGKVVKEIHLPKGVSLANAKLVIRKAFGLSPSAGVDLYVGEQKIESASSSTALYELVSALGGGEIEVKISQSITYDTLKSINEKIKKGISLSSIEQSIWDRGAREMGGEEKITNDDNFIIAYYNYERKTPNLPLEGVRLFYKLNINKFKDSKLLKRASGIASVIIDELVERNTFPKYQTGQQLLPGVKKWISKGEKDFEKHWLGKYKHEAVIYLITCKFGKYKGKQYVGMSYDEEQRWHGHIYQAINPNDEKHKFQDVIKDALITAGFDIDELWEKLSSLENWQKIPIYKEIERILEQYFDREPLEYHLKYDTVWKREKYYIAKFNSFKNGLNSDRGGKGGQYRSLPMYDVAYLIALGLNMKEIAKLIATAYSGVSVTRTVIQNRIQQTWGSFYQAQEELFTPIIKRLIYLGYSGLDIYKNFKSSSVKNSWFAAWSRGKIVIRYNIDQLNHLKDNSRIKNIREFEEKVFYGISTHQWFEWTIQGKSIKQLKLITRLSEWSIESVRDLLFEGKYTEYQIKLRKERTLERIREGWSFERIYTEDFMNVIQTFKKYFTETLFKGMTFEDIRNLAFMSLLPQF